MGAATAAAVAVNHPEAACCVLLEDPPWFSEDSPWYRNRAGTSPEERQQVIEQRRAEIMERKRQSRKEIMAFGREQSPTWDEIEFGPWADSKRQLSPSVIETLAAPRRHWSEIVPQIACPALLITADSDRGSIVTPEIAQQAAAMNPLIELAHIPGAGHNIRREQFQPFIEAVKAFLDEHYTS